MPELLGSVSAFTGSDCDHRLVLEIIRLGRVATTFLFDDDETGLVYLRMHGNGYLDELMASDQCRVLTVERAGHAFSSPASVEWLTDRMGDALHRAASRVSADTDRKV